MGRKESLHDVCVREIITMKPSVSKYLHKPNNITLHKEGIKNRTKVIKEKVSKTVVVHDST